jgi:hypothetical protein
VAEAILKKLATNAADRERVASQRVSQRAGEAVVVVSCRR